MLCPYDGVLCSHQEWMLWVCTYWDGKILMTYVKWKGMLYSSMCSVISFKYRHTSFYCIWFTVLCRCYIFYKFEVCSNSAIFPIAFAHFVSLCHRLVILAIFSAFLLLYLLWWPVNSDVTAAKRLTCWSLRWWLAFFRNKVFCHTPHALLTTPQGTACMRDLSSLTRDGTCALCSGSAAS